MGRLVGNDATAEVLGRYTGFEHRSNLFVAVQKSGPDVWALVAALLVRRVQSLDHDLISAEFKFSRAFVALALHTFTRHALLPRKLLRLPGPWHPARFHRIRVEREMPVSELLRRRVHLEVSLLVLV